MERPRDNNNKKPMKQSQFKLSHSWQYITMKKEYLNILFGQFPDQKRKKGRRKQLIIISHRHQCEYNKRVNQKIPKSLFSSFCLRNEIFYFYSSSVDLVAFSKTSFTKMKMKKKIIIVFFTVSIVNNVFLYRSSIGFNNIYSHGKQNNTKIGEKTKWRKRKREKMLPISVKQVVFLLLQVEYTDIVQCWSYLLSFISQKSSTVRRKKKKVRVKREEPISKYKRFFSQWKKIRFQLQFLLHICSVLSIRLDLR